jgi:hypothetical protein
MAADNFAAWPHVDLESIPTALWRERRDVAWFPGWHEGRARARFAKLVDALLAAGRCQVIVEESSNFLTATTAANGRLVSLCRAARHRQVAVAMTTQYAAADLPNSIKSLEPDVFVFRSSSSLALAAIERDFGFSPQKVAGLPLRSFLRWPASAT